MTQTKFLNVDLELRRSRGLRELIEFLEPRLIVLHASDDFASFEANCLVTSADDAIEALANVIAKLPADLIEIWRTCGARTFNLGVDAGCEPHSAEFGVSNRSLSTIASLGADLAVTVYAAQR